MSVLISVLEAFLHHALGLHSHPHPHANSPLLLQAINAKLMLILTLLAIECEVSAMSKLTKKQRSEVVVVWLSRSKPVNSWGEPVLATSSASLNTYDQ